jgi:hypothetical protein
LQLFVENFMTLYTLKPCVKECDVILDHWLLACSLLILHNLLWGEHVFANWRKKCLAPLLNIVCLLELNIYCYFELDWLDSDTWESRTAVSTALPADMQNCVREEWCELSDKMTSMYLFCLQLLDMLKFYSRFEISDDTGDPLTDHDMTQIHYSRIISLQVSCRTLFDLSQYPNILGSDIVCYWLSFKCNGYWK